MERWRRLIDPEIVGRQAGREERATQGQGSKFRYAGRLGQDAVAEDQSGECVGHASREVPDQQARRYSGQIQLNTLLEKKACSDKRSNYGISCQRSSESMCSCGAGKIARPTIPCSGS